MIIDTGTFDRPTLFTTTSGMDAGQRVNLNDHKRAKNYYNKIKANIAAHESAEALADYWTAEELMLDALHLFDPTVAADLAEIYETRLSFLEQAGAARPALPDNPQSPTAQTGNSGNSGEANNVCIW